MKKLPKERKKESRNSKDYEKKNYKEKKRGAFEN